MFGECSEKEGSWRDGCNVFSVGAIAMEGKVGLMKKETTHDEQRINNTKPWWGQSVVKDQCFG